MGSRSGPIPSPRHNGGYDAQPPPSSFNQSVFNRSPMHPAMSRIGTPLRSSSTTPRFSSGLGPLCVTSLRNLPMPNELRRELAARGRCAIH